MELRWRNTTFLLVLTLLLVSGFLIFFKSEEIPRNLSYDEVAFTHLALSLRSQPPTLYSPLATGHTTPYFYILMVFFNALGVHNWVLRLPAALFGMAAVLMMFLTMYSLFKNRSLAFVLAVVFVCMRWYLTFARFSFEATFLLFLEIAALYFLLSSTNSRKPWMIVTAAIFSSLSFYSYTPGRLFPLVVGIFGYLHMQTKKSMMLLVMMALLIMPLVVVLGTRTDTRIEQVSVISNQSLSPWEKAQAIGGNVVKAASMFVVGGDMNGRHNYPGKPALNPMLALLTLSGLIVALTKIKEG